MTEIAGINPAGGDTGPERTLPTTVEAERLRLKKAVVGFETIFATQLVRQMRRTVPKNEIGESFGQTMMRDIADEAFGEYLGKQGSFGLAEAMYRTLERHLDGDRETGPLSNGSERGPIPVEASRDASDGIPAGDESAVPLERDAQFLPRIGTNGSGDRTP